MHYLPWALYISAAVLLSLPIFGCFFIGCEPHDGAISVSAIIRIKPLSTVYAFWGGVFLTTLTYFQIQCKKGIKVVLAILGSKLLAVPLFLPFGAVSSDLHHYGFAIAGFSVELLYMLCVAYDVFHAPKPMKGAFIIYGACLVAVASVALVLSGLSTATSLAYRRVIIIVTEYLFATSLVTLTQVSYYKKLY
jgi:hypothetical protein